MNKKLNSQLAPALIPTVVVDVVLLNVYVIPPCTIGDAGKANKTGFLNIAIGTDAGNTTNNDITISNLFLNGDAISAIGGSLNLVLGNSNFAIQSDTDIVQNSPTIRFKHSTQRGFTLPNKSGTFILDTDTSSMLSPYLRSNVAAATYQPIGSYLTTGTLTDSLNTNGVTAITLNTPNVIFSTPVTFSKTGRAWSGTLSLNNQSANRVFAGPTTGSAAAPTFRALVAADIPDLSSSYVTTTTYNNAVLDSGWVDWSSSSTIVGWSSYTAKEIRYRRIGKTVWVNYYISGTSNSTNTRFTVPYPLTTNMTFTQALGQATNNGTAASSASKILLSSGSVTVEFSITINGNFSGVWTASGTKTIIGQFFYEIN